MGVKDALFIYLSEYITFMTRAGGEQSQKYEKLRKKKQQIEAKIVNFLREKGQELEAENSSQHSSQKVLETIFNISLGHKN